MTNRQLAKTWIISASTDEPRHFNPRKERCPSMPTLATFDATYAIRPTRIRLNRG